MFIIFNLFSVAIRKYIIQAKVINKERKSSVKISIIEISILIFSFYTYSTCIKFDKHIQSIHEGFKKVQSFLIGIYSNFFKSNSPSSFESLINVGKI